MGLSEECTAWESRVASAIGSPGTLAVAFSGGVDSSVLLALALRHLGSDRVVAVLGVSDSLGADEHEAALEVASTLGAQVVELPTREMEDPGYRANGPDRCFHCKSTLFSQISNELVSLYGIDAVAYGENADDALRPDRPGSQAAINYHVLRPLAQAGLTKEMVRRLARELGLSVADKPASPCLASRIPHFSEVTPEKLAQIDAAESGVRDLGFSDVRVRHHGEIARIEVSIDELPHAVEIRSRLISAVRRAGFRYVTLDLAGIQSGAFTLSAVSHE